MKTHFKTGATGASTVRRSLAALLREPLELRAVPRNLEAPGYFANFAVEPDGDARLTTWMHEHLTISVWPKPDVDFDLELRRMESLVIDRLQPPLNLDKARHPSATLKAARKRMADEARTVGQASGR